MLAACYILHYGREWLWWSMRSIRAQVDEIHVFYTPTPSHGNATSLQNPETRDELHSIAQAYNARWHDTQGFAHEGLHREFAVGTCAQAGADIVLVVDADELWPKEVLSNAIDFAKGEQLGRSYRIGMRHFWRSLNWVCDDPAMPTRIIKPGLPRNWPESYMPDRMGKVFHMGYAQSPEIIRYKQDIHGHKSEWRPGWLEEKFLAWRPGMKDVHPTCVDYWDPRPYQDSGELQSLAGDHPYWGRDVIE